MNFFAEAASLRTTEGANLFTVYNSSLLKLLYFMRDLYGASYNVYIFYMLTIKVDMKRKFLFSDMIVQAKLERRLLTVS